MTKHIIPWAKVKKDYLEGVTPKEIALKYGTTAKTVTDKACKEKWTAEKSIIYENVLQNVQDRIQNITNKALTTLEEIIENDTAKDADRVAASRAVLDISGLKTQKQEISGDMNITPTTLNILPVRAQNEL